MIGLEGIRNALLVSHLGDEGVNELLLEAVGVDLEAAAEAALRFAAAAPPATDLVAEASAFLAGFMAAARLAVD